MTADQIRRNEADKKGLAGIARQIVFAQHRMLRRFLMMGMAHACGGLSDKGPPLEPFRRLIAELQAVFLQHLADEEALILPLLTDDLPLGPARAKALCEEHARQRAELETLCAWPDDGSDQELAARFGQLAVALLEDIAREERQFPIPAEIRGDRIVMAQHGAER